MKKGVKILLIFLILIIIGVIIYITMITIEKNRIEEEKKTVLDNANNLVSEIKKVCENQKSLETEEEKVYKFVIDKGKIDYELDKKITLPDNGIVEINDECEVSLSLVFGEYNVLKNYSEEPKLETVVYENGDVIYYNPELGQICDDYVEDNSLNGAVNGCMKWYTFNDSKDETVVSLILDHNIASSVRWLSEQDYKANKTTEESYNNTLGPITLKSKMQELIKWNVDARIPNLDEILKVLNVSKDKFLVEEEIFFDSKESLPLKSCYKGDTSKCKYSWLYDRTSLTCNEYGCSNASSKDTYGYWLEDYSEKDTLRAYRIYQDGRVTTSQINELSTGIRVVIDIQKSLLK